MRKDGHELNHISPTTCRATPRLRKPIARASRGGADYVERWNSGSEVGTTFTFDPSRTYGQVTLPDGTIYKELFATSGYQKGLTTGTETWGWDPVQQQVIKMKWTTMAWTRDDTGVNYIKNPRVQETNVYDVAGQSPSHEGRGVSYIYSAGQRSVLCCLPRYVNEYPGGMRRRCCAGPRNELRHGVVIRQQHAAHHRIAGPRNIFMKGQGRRCCRRWIISTMSTNFAKQPASLSITTRRITTAPSTAGRANLCITRRYDVNFPTDLSKAASYGACPTTRRAMCAVRAIHLAIRRRSAIRTNFAATATTIPGAHAGLSDDGHRLEQWVLVNSAVQL